MIKQTVLDNGIRIITEQIPVAHSVSLGAWVATGSRHEDAALSGISHFAEHMFFKGTGHRTARMIAREIDAVGGMLNAFTSHEFCCYYAKMLSHNLPLATDLISDILLDSVFDLEEIEKERRIILNEIAMVEDTPDDQIHELFGRLFWKNNPLARPILGTAETVAHFDRDTLLRFVADCYCGENLLITAAGKLEHDKVVDQVASEFSSVPAAGHGSPIESPVCHGGIDVREKSLEQIHICLGTKALPQNDPDRYALYFLNTILGGSMSSRLFQSIREDRGLAYSIYSYLNCHSDTGAQIVYAATAPDQALYVIDLILAELKNLIREPVPAYEFNAAREQLRGNLLLSLENTENRMTRLAKNELYLGTQLSIEQAMTQLESVTADQVCRLANELFRDEYLTLQLLGDAGRIDKTSIDLTVKN
ncbi:MAG: peptidase M16 [Desulfuromonas sp.]|nr:MAG: peptidase M16 [Desulfuromonas sp.]